MKKHLNIALIGYGKMGHEIKKHAPARGHAITVILDREEDWQANETSLKQADVAIEFTAPQSAPANIERCFKLGIPVVCGTTGWHDQLPRIADLCLQMNGTLMHASNFSLGVNIFFELNRKLAAMMATFDNYRVSMSETHHTQKLDAPSGTAVSLAEDIIRAHPGIKSWVLQEEKQKDDQLPVEALRIENVTGTHTVSYHSAIDRIDIRHTAHNRSGFALGALMAAQWVCDKKGVFTMKDLLDL